MSEEPSGGGTTFSLVFISKKIINLHWTLDRLEVVYGILLWIFLGSLQQPRVNWQRRVFISQVYCLVIWWWYFGQLQTSRWHRFLQIKTRPKSAPPSSAGSPETRYLPMLAISHSWHSRMLSVNFLFRDETEEILDSILPPREWEEDGKENVNKTKGSFLKSEQLMKIFWTFLKKKN